MAKDTGKNEEEPLTPRSPHERFINKSINL